jgi:HK97 family phage major capsid protein
MPKSADDLRRERKAAADAMNVAATAMADAADDEASTKAQAEFDKAKADFARLDGQVKAMEAAEAAQAAAAVPAATLPGTTAGGTAPAQVKEKGLRFAAMTRALAAAGGIPYVAAQIAEEMGHSGLFANQNMGTGAAGGFLVPEDVSGEMIELLRPMSVIMASGPVIVPMPNGNLTMNRQATGSNAGYIGEQQDVPATGVTFGQVKLAARKLAALVPISNDLLRAAGVAVDRVVRDDVLASVALKTDGSFLRSIGSDFSPRGLRYQLVGTSYEATNILTMTATPDVTKIINDLARMELALENADIPMLNPGWIMSARVAKYLENLRDANGNKVFPEMALGELNGKPYRKTTGVPNNLGGGTESEIYLADFGQVVVGEHMGMQIAMSEQAAYKDATGTMQAAFSRDETVMRAIVQHDIGLRHLAAVAVLTGVTWGA